MNYSNYQPFMIGDLVEYDGIDYTIVSVKKCGLRDFLLDLTIIDNDPKYLFKYYSGDRNLLFIEDLRVFYYETGYRIGSSKFKIKKRIFQDLCDVKCKYLCPLKDKNIISREFCSNCEFQTNKISPSQLFFINDEVRWFVKKEEDKLICGGNAYIKAIYFRYYELKQLDILLNYFYYSPDKNEKACKLIEETYNIFHSNNLNTILNQFSYTIVDDKLQILKQAELLRLRNRRGFTYDFDSKVDFCDFCSFSDCSNCEYKKFKTKTNKLINNLL